MPGPHTLACRRGQGGWCWDESSRYPDSASDGRGLGLAAAGAAAAAGGVGADIAATCEVAITVGVRLAVIAWLVRGELSVKVRSEGVTVTDVRGIRQK